MSNPKPYAAEVAGYLAYCAQFQSLLAAKYHPTSDGAVKMIHHRFGDKAADAERELQIRRQFRIQTGQEIEPPEAGQ